MKTEQNSTEQKTEQIFTGIIEERKRRNNKPDIMTVAESSYLASISKNPIRIHLNTLRTRSRINGPNNLMIHVKLGINPIRKFRKARLGSTCMQRFQNPCAPQTRAGIIHELEVRVQQGAGGIEVDESDSDVVQFWEC